MPNLYEALQHRKSGGGEGVIERGKEEGKEEGREGEIKEMSGKGEEKGDSILELYTISPHPHSHPTPHPCFQGQSSL